MTQILKELEKDKKTDQKRFEGLNQLKELKLLQSSDDAEKGRIIKALGKDNSITRALIEQGEKIDIAKYDKEYGGNVFTLAQIKALAKKYDLKFLQAKYYRGNLNASVADKILELHKRAGVIVSDGNLETNFMILAEPKAFEEQPKGKDVYYNPALFYSVTAGYYHLIDNWGASFGIYRRLEGIRHASVASKLITESIIIFVTSAIIIGLFTNIISPFLLLSLIPMFINGCIMMPSSDNTDDRSRAIPESFYHEKRWNNPWERRKRNVND